MSEYIVEFGYKLSLGVSIKEQIVRCRDCKYHEPMTVSYLDYPLSVCTADWCLGAEGDNPLVKPEGFCAWGERKDES